MRRPVRLSLRWRVASALGLGVLLLTGLFAVVTWNLASSYMLRQREALAVQQAEVNVRLVDTALQAGSAGLDDLLQGLSTETETTVLLERPDGWITSGRQIGPDALPEPLLALATAGVPARQRLGVAGVPVLAVTLPVAAPGTAYVELFPLSQLDRTFRFLGSVLAAGVVGGGLFGVALGAWASRRALRPLTELTRTASRVAGGDLRARLPDQDDPDLAPLAATFNRTAAALERRIVRDARFASDVSHELRSPLTTMANAAAVLDRRRAEVPGVAGRALELLRGEIGRFQRMVIDLIEISRDDQQGAVDDRGALDEPGEIVDLADLVGNVVAARPLPRPTLEADDPGPVVQGDRRRLDRAVANLLDNAERYGGGAVRVAVLRRGGPGRAGRVRLEVDDEGPGVPPEFREQ
ncbi:MAG: HAMP domain-containing histidine kinase, partial [Pseudonocardia sp.]|nr:HAMP domain-containing histidine kinase [Pseudonocardia sp.]